MFANNLVREPFTMGENASEFPPDTYSTSYNLRNEIKQVSLNYFYYDSISCE